MHFVFRRGIIEQQAMVLIFHTFHLTITHSVEVATQRIYQNYEIFSRNILMASATSTAKKRTLNGAKLY